MMCFALPIFLVHDEIELVHFGSKTPVLAYRGLCSSGSRSVSRVAFCFRLKVGGSVFDYSIARACLRGFSARSFFHLMTPVYRLLVNHIKSAVGRS